MCRRLACEPLEDRRLLAMFLVTNTADEGAGSLRQTLLEANAAVNAAGPDLIAFSIAGMRSHDCGRLHDEFAAPSDYRSRGDRWLNPA